MKESIASTVERIRKVVREQRSAGVDSAIVPFKDISDLIAYFIKTGGNSVPNDLDEVICMIEQLRYPDREADAFIHRQVFGVSYERLATQTSGINSEPPPAYTESLDAAKILMPEKADYGVVYDALVGYHSWVRWTRNDAVFRRSATSRVNDAIALTLACLYARRMIGVP